MAATYKIALKMMGVDRLSGPLKKVGAAVDSIRNRTANAINRFRQMQASTEGLRKSLSKIGKGMRNVGKSMTTGMTLPIGAAGYGIIKMAADFEKSMNKVQALTGATDDQFNAMRNMAKDLGATTKFSASEAADAMSFLGMAGWKTNQILAGTPALLDLAAASNIELARAADIASNIMGAFGLEAKEAGRVSDVLAAVTANSNVDMEMLAETMKEAGPVGKQFGASLESVAAAAGLLGNIGIQGSNAGTALKRAFLALSAPAGEAGQVLEAAGIKVADAQGNMLDFGTIMADLGGQLSKMPQQLRMKVLDAVFGKIGIAGASAMQEFAKTGELDKFTERLKNVEGTAHRMAETMNRGAAGSMVALKSAAEGLAIAIGDSGLLDMFTEMVQKVTSVVREISQANPALFRGAVIVAALAAALGPLIFVFGLLASALPPIITAITFFAGVLSWPVVAIAALIAAGVALYTYWDEIKQFFIDLWNDPMAMFDKFITFVKESFEALKDPVGLLKSGLESLGNMFTFGVKAEGTTTGTTETAADRREQRTVPAFGAERTVSNNTTTVNKSQSEVNIHVTTDKDSKVKMKSNLKSPGININMGPQGAVGGTY